MVEFLAVKWLISIRSRRKTRRDSEVEGSEHTLCKTADVAKLLEGRIKDAQEGRSQAALL